ncbi:peptidase [Clostridiaceae bacterium]|nr:peptidase [Clostridiaceae bacterium]RKI09694.1 peptidase [bacterium 1XD21-70]
MSHDREFQKRKSRGRQPARKPVTDTRADEGRGIQDFDLRRGAASGEDTHRRRQNQGREMQADQAGSPVTEYAGMETGTGSGGAGFTAADFPTGNTDMTHGAEAGYAAGKIQTDTAPEGTAPREYNLHWGQGEPAFREDAHRHRQSRRTHTEQPADTTAESTAPRDYDLRREPDMPDTRESAHRRRQDQSRKMHAEQTDRKELEVWEADMPLHEAPSYGNGNKETNHGEPAKPDTPFREEPARAGSRRDSRSRQEESGHTVKQHGSKYQQRFQKEAKAEEQAAGDGQKKPSKLEFTADELPPEQTDKKLLKAERKAEQTERKLDRAEGRLPSRKKLRMETASDPDTGKAKKRLKVEKEAKTQRAHVKGPAPLRPVKAGANAAVGYAHKKVYEAENENVGVKAAHRTELVGEAGARTAWYRHKTATYRRVEKLQKKSMRAKANAAYRQTLHERPELKKNLLARMWQKKKLKRQYAKAAREAQKAGKMAKNTAVTTERIAMGIVRAAKRHPVICAILLFLLLLFFLLASLISSFSNLGTGSLGSIAASSYLAEDRDIDRAELAYTEWETDLQMEINRVETDRPGYDEYRYQIGAIEHDPFELMGFLTSVYQDFSYGEIEGVLQELFGAQYSLSYTEETETRYRTETETDPETGEETEVEVPYEWHILNVKLSATPLGNVIVSRMDSGQKEICEILLSTKGCRQYVENVFGTANWLPYVTSGYGYRVHPISGGKDYHTGVDIGMPQGTDILAGHDGRVTLAGNAGGYGLCVAVEGRAYGEHTLTTKYGHCSQILVSAGQEVKAGDVIARVGSTGNSTGPHLHLEVLADGQYLNPLYFAETGDNSERRLPTAGPGGGGDYLHYDIPPEALSDERFAAMIAEAEKYLGYPYVWGGASPSTSFDCSGYVSWVVNHSGWNFGRLTANGLLGVCAPVSGADARPGDLVFFQGTYNTSGASHVGIYVGNGMMIHCGDPISYANINTSYWQSHFYTFGRLP